jgi:signal transduction histidine kinase
VEPAGRHASDPTFSYAVYRIASAFASLDGADMIIDKALAVLGEVCSAARAYLFLFDDEATTMNNTHEWCAPGVTPEIEMLTGLPLDMFPWWMQRLRNGEMILVPDVSGMPAEAAAEREILEQQSVTSVLVLPVYRDGGLIGFIGLDNVRTTRTWDDDTREYLQVAAEMVSSTITRDHRARTAHRRTEELNAAYENLKMTQAQLLQSEKLASIGMLAAGVAHEINNPIAYVSSNTASMKNYLRKITAFARSALAGTTTEELRNAAARDDIEFLLEDGADILTANSDGLRRVTEIVRNLMNFSRVSQSEGLEREDVRDGIVDTIDIAANMLKYTVDVELRTEEIPRVPCRLSELNQVFLNLLVNSTQAIASAKSAARGHITVETSADETHVHCVFRDNGPGFEEEAMSRVFEPFFTTKEVGQGTGLGMSIAYDIVVNKHNGKIAVGNNEGGGAFVQISLPIDP